MAKGTNEKKPVFHEKKSFPTVEQRGGSIMLWACVALSSTGNISLEQRGKESPKCQLKNTKKKNIENQLMILNTSHDPQ